MRWRKNMEQRKYKHLIFDIDGTLLDTEKTGVLSLQKTVKELMGKDMSYDELYPYFGIPTAVVVEQMDFEDKELATHLWEKYFRELMYLIVPFEGVPEMLPRLREMGFILGLVTSRNRFEFDFDSNLSKWKDLFDTTITSDDSERHKPFPDPLLTYISQSGAVAKECIYFGDTEHDFECAKGAGIDFALADWRNRGFQGIPAKYRFSSVEEIVAISR
ncbi:MAG: HAD family hydrolase [Bacteroidales bacterium]|nr:HAD family hydrolase [Bacteroidales bacterium]